MDSLANRYASALLSIALEQNKNAEYRSYVKEIVKAIQENKEFLNLLTSAFITKSERKQIVNQILKDAPFKEIVSFMDVIIDNDRGNLVLNILVEFISISNRHDNIAEGIIYSTINLDSKQMDSIAKAISMKINRQVYLKNQIDERLIGGIKVVIEDYIFDGSLNYKITNLKNMLLEGNE